MDTPVGKRPLLRGLLSYISVKLSSLNLFIIWMAMGGNCLMLHFYECTFCVNGISGASRTIPPSIPLFPVSRGPPVCALDVTASGFSSVLTNMSSSLHLYHSEACQTLNRKMCGPRTCLFLATARHKALLHLSDLL
jgi:hypothetical protein